MVRVREILKGSDVIDYIVIECSACKYENLIRYSDSAWIVSIGCVLCKERLFISY